MIDGIGRSGAGAPALGKANVERSNAAAPAGSVRSDGRVGEAGFAADAAAAGPPVDAGKVAAIRAAIAEGRYPVDPARIAERMVALDLPAKSQA